MELALNVSRKSVDPNNLYDVIIIGGGTAALGAGLYATRYELSTLIITKEIGGAIIDAPKVENYLGIDSVSGVELIQRFRSHAENYGAQIIEGRTVIDIEKEKTEEGEIFKIKTDTKEEFKSKTIIIATGTHRRKLGLENEEKLTGKGISYCATCDAPFFKDKVVGVVGGGDSAVIGAIQLADLAKKVYLLVRSKVKAEPINQEALKPYIEQGKVEIIQPVTVQEIIGEEKLTAVKLSNGETLQLDGLFIEIGGIPNTDIVEKFGIVDETRHIKVDNTMKTSYPGIFAAGDVINHPLKQCITAAAEGAVAAYSCYQYIRGIKEK